MRLAAAIALIVAANIALAAEPTPTCHALAEPTLVAAELPMDSVRQFLDLLRAHPESTIAVGIVCTETWITEEELELLAGLLDSTEPCAAVTSAYSSRINIGETSTIGDEAARLLDGYRRRVYGDGRSVVAKDELKTWWEARKARQ